MPEDVDRIVRASEEALEFDQIRDALAQLCQTEQGVMRALRQVPFSDQETLREYCNRLVLLDEEGWNSPLLRSGKLPSLSAVFAQTAKTGSVLSLMLLARVRQFVDYYRQLHDVLNETSLDMSMFLPSLNWETLRRLTDLVHPQGELQELMDPILTQILGHITAFQRASMECAQKIMQEHPEWFTSDVPVLRNERITLPLSSKYRTQLSGVLLAISETGLTLFIEPTEVVQLNNRLAAEKIRREKRINEILRELSDLVYYHTEPLQYAETKLADFDLLCAKLEWGRRHGAQIIIPSGDRLHFSQAVHPLLMKDFSPLEITLLVEKKVLVLSGPNAGGKTVLLKTVGLLALMAHCGIPVTVGSESCLPFFLHIHCVLGDSQSLERSLSSFSGRLTQIAGIFPLSMQSLVLLDELGNDTDPQEGSALSCAFLDAFLSRESWVIVTTHLHLVKVYALRHARMHCAAMGFDEQSHSPDYCLIMNHLGLSHAFESAERCGIPSDVLASARRYADAEDPQSLVKNFSILVDEYQQRFQSLKHTQREVGNEQTALAEERRKVGQREEELKKQKRSLLRELRKEASGKLDALVRELREQGLTEKMQKQMQEFRQDLTQQITDTATRPAGSPVLQVGQWVRWRGGKSQGVVQEIDSKGSVYVQFGEKRVRVTGEMLEACEEKLPAALPTQIPSSHSARIHIDLRGERLWEAEQQTDQHLQQAVVAGLSRVEIIHGMGNGILRRGLREFLANHALVERWENADPRDGGAGKTIAYLVQ